MKNKKISKEDGQLEVIQEYKQRLDTNPNCISSLSLLAEAYEKAHQLDKAMHYYRKVVDLQPEESVALANLARVRLKLEDIEGSLVNYVKALALSQPTEIVYQGFGDALEKNGQILKAIAAYKQAIRLNRHKFGLYQSLIYLYFKSIPYKVSRFFCKIKSVKKNLDKSACLQLWEKLNQIELNSTLERACSYSKNDLDVNLLERYFIETDRTKIINLASLTEQDKEVIKNSGLSIENLQSNTTGLITKWGIVPEPLSAEELSIKLNIPQQVAANRQRNRFQLSAIEEGCIYAICPSTGTILSSNRSLILPKKDLDCIFYRFVGTEVFYLVTGFCWLGFPKLYLYFPKSELVILLCNDSNISVDRLNNLVHKSINQFKSYAVINFKKIYSYLLKTEDISTVSLIGIQHFAHHLWNELSGIYKIYENHLLSMLDRLIVAAEPLGLIDDIFPEIPSLKIQRIKDLNQVLLTLDGNYFVVRVGDNYIREDLANRIYKASYRYCHPTFLAEVKETKQKHFPLLWISIRLDTRTWISQVEGIANIIKAISDNFPDLGVVLDGFSMAKGPLSWGEETIQKETKTVRQIRAILPSEIKIYDAVGCTIYESFLWAHAIDLYLVHHGSIQHKVGWIANKPGVVHTNKKVLEKPISQRAGSWERENCLVPVWISDSYITNLDDCIENSQDELRNDLENYDCNWRAVYNEILKLALSIKKIKE